MNVSLYFKYYNYLGNRFFVLIVDPNKLIVAFSGLYNGLITNRYNIGFIFL